MSAFGDKYRKTTIPDILKEMEEKQFTPTSVSMGTIDIADPSISVGERYRRSKAEGLERPTPTELVEKGASPFKLTGETILEAVPEKKPPLGFIGRAVDTAFNVIQASIENATNKIVDFWNASASSGINLEDYSKIALMEPKEKKKFLKDYERITPLERSTKLGQAALGIAEMGFLPFTTQIEAAKEVPILKYPASVASWGFEKLGQLGTFVMSNALNIIPIPDKEKEVIRPFAEELGAFITQVGGIKVAHGVMTKGIKGVEKLPISEKAKVGITTGTQITAGIGLAPFTTMYKIGVGTLQAKISQRQQKNIEITKEEAKKIIEETKQEVVKRAEKIEPEIIEKVKEIRVEKPVDGIALKKIKPKTLKPITKPTEIRPVAKPKVKKPVRGKPTKVALSIEAKAIERGLTKGFKDLAEYTPTTIRRQSKRISDLMARDMEKAKRMATGKETLNPNIKGAMLIKVMEDYAMRTNDGKLALELANSPLVAETSVAGQTLRLIREREADSATAKIQELKKTREKVFEKKAKGKSPKKIKSEMKEKLEKKIKETKPKKYSWEQLIKDITC